MNELDRLQDIRMEEARERDRLRSENRLLRARVAELEAECDRWADASIAEDNRRARGPKS